MNRLTTDHPQNSFETVMNLVYGKDGWQYIRHGETEMRTTDFCLMLCKERESHSNTLHIMSCSLSQSARHK